VLSPRAQFRHSAFTLIELLVVVGTIAMVIVLVIPAFTKIKSANDLTAAAYIIATSLEQGRSYAMANNTFVWVGFYEENTTVTAPTHATPPYPGNGRVLIATVFSSDGTKIYDDAEPTAHLPPNRIKQIGKLVRIEGVHITDIGAPPSPTPLTASADSLDARSSWPYSYAAGIGADHFNRISSDSPDATRFGFIAQDYTFSKSVRFNPRGEANLNSTYSFKNAAEIGLKPTHGTIVDNSPNVVAIQFGGVGGDFKVYHR
jgi:type II secretory pathway pseudopilin PulG